ncbi:hypothetical protein [uncultured Brevundimonas sp.]|uniref:hypothetical protein n=1 Tax=uncultured Brevundimonas sp. TaxID=213418 RepID=UPI0026016BEA|nr:hypothetical protein [uncultured Brevundimonas sp.]
MTNTMTPSEIADWLDRRGALFDEEAAATIRAQAEALKIATEALEEIGSGRSVVPVWIATQALARMKEVV